MIEISKPVRRVVFDARHGDLVVTMRPEGVELRKKGHRTTYGPISYGLLFLTGARIRAEETVRQRKMNRRRAK